jgi:hypothetical protein
MASRRANTENATEILTLRLSPSDRVLLNRLVQHATEELASEGVEVTVTSVVRGLIRHAAKSKGLTGNL